LAYYTEKRPLVKDPIGTNGRFTDSRVNKRKKRVGIVDRNKQSQLCFNKHDSCLDRMNRGPGEKHGETDGNEANVYEH